MHTDFGCTTDVALVPIDRPDIAGLDVEPTATRLSRGAIRAGRESGVRVTAGGGCSHGKLPLVVAILDAKWLTLLGT